MLVPTVAAAGPGLLNPVHLAIGRPDVMVVVARPDASADPARRAPLLALLSPDERQRLCCFRFDRDRLLFLVAHALVRLTLSHQAPDVPPRHWQFHAGCYGRPEIASPRSTLRFSLSHTRGLAACAVVRDREIGLDVEAIPARAPLDVADHFFSPSEADDVRRTSDRHRAGRFIEYWTLKEAYVKARGIGLSLPLDRFAMRQASGAAWRVAFAPPLDDDARRWWFRSLRIGDGHQLAVAVGARDRREALIDRKCTI
jgi:4'-phosphopantetheinyl transferase